jgi:crotonyl-CoA reductase
MLVSPNGAHMKQGDVVLIWGATGGIGAYATQYVLNGGGIPIGVVSSADKAEILRGMGVEAIIDRRAGNYQFWKDETTHDEKEWKRFGSDIRALVGEDPDIVFEHPGRSTFAASMYVAKKGGTFANYREAWEANRLIQKGMIHPVLSQVFDLNQTGDASYQVHKNMHEGKIGVLCMAPREGMGINNPEFREKVGEKNLRHFRRS